MTFAAYSQEKRAQGDDMLRVTQFSKAINEKDRGMLIWLGKQRLGQHDNPVHTVDLKVPEDRLLNGVTKEELIDMLADDNSANT